MHDQHSESSVAKTVGIKGSFEKTNFINLLVCDIPDKWQMSPQVSVIIFEVCSFCKP
jgi:hypothetical protein